MKRLVPMLLILLGWGTFIAINVFSVYYSLYYYLWWLDIFMHTYGGFLLVFSWFLVKRVGAFKWLMTRPWFQPLLILWVVMIVWELFEFRFGLITQYGYVTDTLTDFFNGFAGGLLAFLLNRSRTIQR
jgi:hypothetical protein